MANQRQAHLEAAYPLSQKYNISPFVGRSRTYILPDKPIPRAAHKHGRFGSWDPQKQLKLVTGCQIKSQHQGPLFSGPLQLEIVFFFKRPKASKTKSKAHNFFCATKPDTDNLLKHYLDSAKSIIFKDDCLIVRVVTAKLYDDVPRTEFRVTELR